jgi:hypothetical protein
MPDSESIRVVRELVVEARKLKNQSFKEVTPQIPAAEREAIRNELVDIAYGLIRKHAFTIPQVRHFLHELLDVSV